MKASEIAERINSNSETAIIFYSGGEIDEILSWKTPLSLYERDVVYQKFRGAGRRIRFYREFLSPDDVARELEEVRLNAVGGLLQLFLNSSSLKGYGAIFACDNTSIKLTNYYTESPVSATSLKIKPAPELIEINSIPVDQIGNDFGVIMEIAHRQNEITLSFQVHNNIQSYSIKKDLIWSEPARKMFEHHPTSEFDVFEYCALKGLPYPGHLRKDYYKSSTINPLDLHVKIGSLVAFFI